MRKVIRGFEILIMFSISIQAQSELEEALKYYPLDFGNYWEYVTISDDYIFGFDTSYYSIAVFADTLMPNGKKYKTLKKKYFSSDYSSENYQRIDSLKANVYQYNGEEFLIDSLLSQPNDISKAGRGGHKSGETVCTQISIDSIFGSYFETKFFERTDQPIDWEYKLAKGLGYIGEEICEGTCSWEVLIHAKIGDKVYGESITSLGGYKDNLLKNFILYQNYPNPFNPTTNINFTINKPAKTILVIYNSIGEKISELTNKYLNQGTYSIEFDASNLSSGVYFYRLKSGSYFQTQKMLLIQ